MKPNRSWSRRFKEPVRINDFLQVPAFCLPDKPDVQGKINQQGNNAVLLSKPDCFWTLYAWSGVMLPFARLQNRIKNRWNRERIYQREAGRFRQGGIKTYLYQQRQIVSPRSGQTWVHSIAWIKANNRKLEKARYMPRNIPQNKPPASLWMASRTPEHAVLRFCFPVVQDQRSVHRFCSGRNNAAVKGPPPHKQSVYQMIPKCVGTNTARWRQTARISIPSAVFVHQKGNWRFSRNPSSRLQFHLL